jgi:PAS domain S-box-containing protein
VESLTREEAERMLHELQLHEIELEIQNQTLMAAQIALEESRERFLKFYECSPVGYLTLTDTCLIADINQTGAKLLGAERGKLQRQPFARFVSPGDADCLHLHLASVMKRDDNLNCDLALRQGDGVPRFVRLDSLRLIQDGLAPSVRVMLTDITERKQAEKRLAESEAELRRANENIKLAGRAV